MGKIFGASDAIVVGGAALIALTIVPRLWPARSSAPAPPVVVPAAPQGTPGWNILPGFELPASPRIDLEDPRTGDTVTVSPGFGNPILAPFFPVPIAPEAWNPLDSSFPHATPGGLPAWLDEGLYRVTHPFWWTEGAV